MKSVSISVAKNTLSALIRKIHGGSVITITDRGVPVARLVPPANVQGVPPAAVDLAARGLLRLPETALSPDWSSKLPARPRLRKGASVLKALIEERESGW